MPRSTKVDKAKQLNAAYRLLARNIELPEAAQRLSREFCLSRRQAYRYLEEAAQLSRPAEVVQPSVPITLKLPQRTIQQMRSYAKRSGLTVGEIVTRALAGFLSALRRHG